MPGDRCGMWPGLGYTIYHALFGSVRYTGLDISPRMIAQCRQRWPRVALRVGTTSDLGAFAAESFDATIRIFSSFSCTDDPGSTVAGIHRVLKPGGRASVTMLNRRSLRRQASLKLSG
jgi:ubiquinone/menaquinone biosynthesis C-methylase UbiE